MQNNGYETGRLDLPFVDICTFAKSPVCLDWDKIDADVAILGMPNDRLRCPFRALWHS